MLSIKTGGCAEDCGYCSQSVHAESGLKASKLMDVDAVLEAAREAKAAGSQRFCMGAAWREPKDRDMDAICAMVEGVNALGLQSCMTLGMLSDAQAERLGEAGLDYYNHNLDTSPENYGAVITTRTWQDRIDTLDRVRDQGINVCCGGIVGMGETREDRVSFLHALATLPEPPESVPINALVPVPGHGAGRYPQGCAERADRRCRIRPHGRGRAYPDAPFGRAPLSRPREHVGHDAGAVFPGGRELDLHRRQVADDGQRRKRQGCGAVRQAGAQRLRAAATLLALTAGGGMVASCARTSQRPLPPLSTSDTYANAPILAAIVKRACVDGSASPKQFGRILGETGWKHRQIAAGKKDGELDMWQLPHVQVVRGASPVSARESSVWVCQVAIDGAVAPTINRMETSLRRDVGNREVFGSKPGDWRWKPSLFTEGHLTVDPGRARNSLSIFVEYAQLQPLKALFGK